MTPEQLAWLKSNKAVSAQKLKKGCAVRGTPGRSSENWVGVIVGNEPFPDGRDYWQVRWMDRELSPISNLSKCPTIGHLANQLVILERQDNG